MGFDISVSVDGQQHVIDVEPRLLLIQALREKLKITGPHIGCESGRCGACVVLMNGHAVKSCMTLAVQADGAKVITAAGLAEDKRGRELQSAFHKHHALQCGYCTPGMLCAAVDLLEENLDPDDHEIREALRGNLCRCTGYQHIVDAVKDAAHELSSSRAHAEGGEA